MKRRIILLLPLIAVALLASSCHRECRCTGYNGLATVYTAEEVEAQGGNCSQMVYQAGVRYHSYCEWE